MGFTATDVREEGDYVRVTGRLDARWEVVARVTGEPPRLVGLSVHLVGGGAEALTSEVLRAVPLTAVMAEASRFSRRDAVASPAPVVVTAVVPDTDHAFARAAARYVDFVSTGSRRPVADLAEELEIKPAAARDLIHACREKGLLPKSRPGLPGGTLTAKARRLLGIEVLQRVRNDDEEGDDG
jgi:hypothetical protein